MDSLGDYLKEARIRQGLSLKDVYRETGISDSRLSRIENGSTAFLVDLLINAGYLDAEALSSYERVFRNVDLLSDDERNHIQEQIDLFTKGRKNT